jgi:hypothetical protein
VGLIDRGEEPVRGVEAEIESAKLRHLPSAGRTPMRWAVDGDDRGLGAASGGGHPATWRWLPAPIGIGERHLAVSVGANRAGVRHLALAAAANWGTHLAHLAVSVGANRAGMCHLALAAAANCGGATTRRPTLRLCL